MRGTKVIVDLEAIRHNYKLIQSKTNKKMIGIVKANAYGNGAYEVSQLLIQEGVDYLAVAYLEEAIELREKGIDFPILSMGATMPEDIELAKQYNVTLGIYSIDFLRKINVTVPMKFHLKIDTGMNRLGLKTNAEIIEALKIIKNNPNIILEGVYTHFATADGDEIEYKKQVKRFEEVVDLFDLQLEYIHVSNSAASLLYEDRVSNAVRPGIALYGLKPSDQTKDDLKTVFHLYSKVMLLKKLKAGESVSYGYTYTAIEDETIALLPIGYADGWLRKNQNRFVYINNKRYPIVGRICMDQMLVRVDSNVHLYDDVELIGKHITADEVAKDLGTINYEVICTIGKRVRREYLEESIDE